MNKRVLQQLPGLFLFLVFLFPFISSAGRPEKDHPPAKLFQDKTVTGSVLEAGTDQALIGASVEVSGQGIATQTDENGRFSLEVPADTAVLIVKYIGFQDQEVPLNGRDEITVHLELSVELMDEIMVVGYGTQKRSSVTGAVSQVGAEVFENRPVVNIAQGLQGAIPNLNISFGDGQLNRGGTFNVRGFNSINGGTPLILIDGTPGDVNLLNPEDIESVSVLKDAASSAIYGARAAFGVVLITTKSGGGDRTQIRYTSNFGFGTPIGIPSVVNNSLEAAEIQNEAYRGFAGTDAPGMTEIISYLRQRQEDPTLPELGVDASGNFIRGASTDWYGEFYNDKAPFSKNYLSLSGSQGNTGYYLSMGYESQQGIFEVATDKYKRYSVNLKLNNKPADWIEISNNASFNLGDYDTPNKFVSEGGYNVYRYLSLYANPYEAIKTPNGNYTAAGMSTFGQLLEAGRTNEKDQVLKNTFSIRTNFLDDRLRVNGDYTYFLTQVRNDIQYFRMRYENTHNNVVDFTNPDYYFSGSSDNVHQILNLYTEYEDAINDHHFKGLIGYNQELNRYDGFNARRDENISRNLGSLNLTSGIAQMDGQKFEWALMGIFGRFNYDYKNKYLIEFNGRYDGTSRFERSRRFGFFPSVSVGWNISEEAFFSPLRNTVQGLKIRGSYGSLGNQLVDNYAYISTMEPYTISDLLEVNGELPIGISAPALIPYNLTWESARTLNIGFDMSLFRNRLRAGFDWYRRNTLNMLTKGKTLPAVLGTAEPEENAADLLTKGWELSLSWDDQTSVFNKPFAYSVSVVLSDNRSFITRYDNPSRLLTDYYVGQEIGEIWGYKTLGFFKTDEESAGHADQSRLHLFPGLPQAGDIKFEDSNQDGVIDFGENTVDNPGDLHRIGNTSPRYAYGINLGFDYSNFSLSIFLQGIGKRDFWPGTEAAVFWGFYNRWNQPVYEHIKGNYWTPENPDAYFPRLRAYEALSTDRSLGAVQTRYLQSAAYLRLKSLTLGYRLPESLTSKIDLSSVQVFFAGQNLFEWTKLSEAFDPEGINDEVDSSRDNGAGFVYPLQRTYTLGLEVNF